jgi:hypothetical protein
MDKCSAFECYQAATVKIGESFYCFHHYGMYKQTTKTGGVVERLLCVDNCLAHLLNTEIVKLPSVGRGVCPKCQQTGWLRVASRSQ